MDILIPSFFMMAQFRMREYLLTRPWGVLMNPVSLARIFEIIDRDKALKAGRLNRARVGSEIKLLDKKNSTLSTIVLTEPENSNPSFGKISYMSLLGSELLGVIPGQTISVKILGTAIDFQILGIKNTQEENRR